MYNDTFLSIILLIATLYGIFSILIKKKTNITLVKPHHFNVDYDNILPERVILMCISIIVPEDRLPSICSR